MAAELAGNAGDSSLFKPLQVGSLKLAHRLVMAPLTRFRADGQSVPVSIMIEYYKQRACIPGTLLITEATFISPQGSGLAGPPGIWSRDQIAYWKAITKSVHEQGSYIFCQLWALGRAAEPKVLKERYGLAPIGADAIPMPSYPARRGISSKPPTPRKLSEDEIWQLVKDYAQAARNAVEAGFDGVEIHGANGYLIDQFTQDKSNQRDDEWGGTIEKRSRFGLEVAKAVVAAIGKERVGIRLSPYSDFQGMKMADPIPQFSYLSEQLARLGLAYLHVTESRVAGGADASDPSAAESEKLNFIVDAWHKGGARDRPVLIAGGFKPDSAVYTVDQDFSGIPIAIVFGRLWISNPDLVFRIKNGLPLNPYNRKTFYTAGTEGYLDYPFHESFDKAKPNL